MLTILGASEVAPDVVSYGVGKALVGSGLGDDLADAGVADGEAINPQLKQLLTGCANSFIGTTPVLMADGTSEAIDQVKVGDKIASLDPSGVAVP